MAHFTSEGAARQPWLDHLTKHHQNVWVPVPQTHFHLFQKNRKTGQMPHGRDGPKKKAVP